MTGDLRAAVEAGERGLAVFEAHHNDVVGVPDALRPQHGGQRARRVVARPRVRRRVVEYGREVDDLRLKVVGLWRSGSTHIQRGAVAEGLQCCEEALALSPIAFDAVWPGRRRATG